MSFMVERSVSTMDVDGAIMLILAGLGKKFGKNYCFPSQEKLLYLLSRFHGIKICLRTLNYHLSRLTEGGYIHRQRRIAKGRDGVLYFKSTLYFLRKHALQWIAKLRRLSSCLSSKFRPVGPKKNPERSVSRERAKEILREIQEKLDSTPVLTAIS